MKKFSTIFICLCASLFGEETPPLPASREHVLSIGGSAGYETFDNLKSAGVLKLSGSTVKHLLEVQGCLIAQAAQLESIDIHGEANLTDTFVSGPSTVTGYLRAQGSTFKSLLTLSTHKAVFTASKLNSITIQRQEAFKGKQIIELKQGTIVEGPIRFESGKGEVHLYPGSKLYAPIEGGKLIRKN